MANPLSRPEVDSEHTGESWLTRPLSSWRCVLGWCAATGAFMACVSVPGGPAVGDAFEIVYPTWAVAHGQLTCMYPPHPPYFQSFAAPLYPLIDGAVGFVTRIGHGAPFPTGSALGHNCARALDAMNHWSEKGGALSPTLWSGYVSWLILMAGLIWLLRAAGRGRDGWEPTALVVVACLPPVWLCIEMYAHPQDLVAMGFALGAMACALRSQWVGAGILIALAILTQQYALLVAIPLFVVAPTARKLRYVVAAAATAVLIAVPLLAVTSGAAARSIFAGSGSAGGFGGTVVWEMHVRVGAPLLLVSRLPPLLLSLALAWYVVRHLGPSALHPTVLLSLVAVSLSFRLVFEDNLFAYYFMALTVVLVVLDVVHGRIRESLVAWVAMITAVNSESITIQWRRSWGMDAGHWIPIIVVIVGLLLIVLDVLRHAVGWNVVMWAATVIAALMVWQQSGDPLSYQLAPWIWQIVLVAVGIALAASPLLALFRRQSELQPAADVESTASLS